MLNLNSELVLAKKAATTAGKILQEKKVEINNVLSDQERDIKLEADQASEKIIKDIIQAESDIPILAEESGADGDLDKNFWVIDPLDGTSNYSRDMPICCVSIGLICEDRPALGVIYDFNAQHLYEGITPSFSNSGELTAKKDGLSISVSGIDDKKKATLATGLPAKGAFDEDSMSKLANEFTNWKKVRMIGSAAMSCAYVAAGQFDQYQESGIFLWDIAAGLAIIEAAGGAYIYHNLDDEKFKVNVVAHNNKLR